LKGELQVLNNYLPSDYQTFIATSRYARWIEDKGRRETWVETVQRYTDYLHSKGINLTGQDWDDIEGAILELEVMPSMRALMTAGVAADRDNTCIYNCSYVAVDDPRAFDEAMFILLCGTGVGFSVERQSISLLPEIPNTLGQSEDVIVVQDSKEGWAKALRKLISLLYTGDIPKWNLDKIRPAGSRLKTFGGRASGPEPLNDLFNFVVAKFKGAMGRKLNSIECHDIMCKIGEVVVVGGVRRSAMISLSNLSDTRMSHAKSGSWWENEPQRALANNSACYTEKPDSETFLREWLALVESKSGERGIFSRVAAEAHVAKNGRRETGYAWGTNPCSEIILRSNQFCNLTEVVVRETDDLQSLKRKVRLATILGTAQATFTHMPYLRHIWTKNTSEERLLGVSLTGIMDHPVLGKNVDSAKWLAEMKQVAIDTNAEYAERLGIEVSAAITCVKPSGTVSQLVDSASGIHARHSDYYIRTVRGDNKDPLTQFLKDAGIPAEADVMKPDATTVFSFPTKSPSSAVTRNAMTAIQQLELWKTYAEVWSEHKPSVTITVRDHEWMEVGAWVYKHFDLCSGISFLPHSDHTYAQAPYQECTAAEYAEMKQKMPTSIDWSALSLYEKEDHTSGSQTLACTSGACEIVDIAS
jgi:ribonucleoside-diphosphate reductase alpha chain